MRTERRLALACGVRVIRTGADSHGARMPERCSSAAAAAISPSSQPPVFRAPRASCGRLDVLWGVWVKARAGETAPAAADGMIQCLGAALERDAPALSHRAMRSRPFNVMNDA
jgi:hypothetical protein